MGEWLKFNWWWLLPGLGVILWFAVLALRFRTHAGVSFPKRVIYTLVPQLHPDSAIRRKMSHGRVVELRKVSQAGVVELALIFLVGVFSIVLVLHTRMSVDALIGLVFYIAIAAAFAGFWHRIWRLATFASIVAAVTTATSAMALEYVTIGKMPELALALYVALFVLALAIAGIVQLATQRRRATEASIDA